MCERVVGAYSVGIDECPVFVFEGRYVFEIVGLVVLWVSVDVIDFVALWSRAYPCRCYEFVLRLVVGDEVAASVVVKCYLVQCVSDGERVRVVPFR